MRPNLEPVDHDDVPANTWREFDWGVIIFLGILFFVIGW